MSATIARQRASRRGRLLTWPGFLIAMITVSLIAGFASSVLDAVIGDSDGRRVATLCLAALVALPGLIKLCDSESVAAMPWFYLAMFLSGAISPRYANVQDFAELTLSSVLGLLVFIAFIRARRKTRGI